MYLFKHSMLTLSLHPFPVLETNRLLLRQITNDDAQDIFEFRSSEEAMKYISRPIAKTIDDALNLIALMDSLYQKEVVIWGICYKETNTIIGTIAYLDIDKENHRAEIGYMLHPNYHRIGLMQEAIETIIKFGFEHFKLHTIAANVAPDNIASKNILIKNGFEQQAHLKENFFYNGEFLDTAIFCLKNKYDS